jgi:hypothetical protein
MALLEEAMVLDPRRATPELVSTLLARAKEAMQKSVGEAIVFYRKANDLDREAPKPLRGLVQALVKRSRELTEASDLAASRQILTEALDLGLEAPGTVRDGVTDVRLIAALRVFGERCLLASDRDLSLAAGSLLERAAESLERADREDGTLLWTAASLALGSGGVSRGVELLRLAAAVDSEPIARQQMAILVKRSLQLVESGDLQWGGRVLEGAVAFALEAPEVVGDGVTDVRLVAALRVFGERCLLASDRDLSFAAGSLLERAAESLEPVDGGERSLFWIAASLAFDSGDLARASQFATKAGGKDREEHDRTGIGQSELARRKKGGTRVLAGSDAEKTRRAVRCSVVASPSRTVFVNLEADTDNPHPAQSVTSLPALPPDRIFNLARRLADESITQLDDLLPEVFVATVPGIDLRSVHRFVFTLRLALREIPKFAAFLSDVSDRRAHAVLVDPLVDEKGVERLLEEYGLGHPPGGLDIRYSGRALPSEILGSRIYLSSNHLTAPYSTRGGALVVVGSDVELPFLRPISEVLAKDGPVTFLGKEDTEAALRALTDLAELGQIVTAQSIRGSTGKQDGDASPTDWAQSLDDRFRSLGRGLQGSVRIQLSALESLDRTALGFSRIIDRVGPETVVGSLDRSVFGLLSIQLSRRDRFRTVNLQHGTVMPSRTSDLLGFDLSLAWNEWSRDLVVQDGYPKDARIEIVGNPRWDRLGMIGAEELGSRHAELAVWKGDDYLAVVFPQPPKGPFLDTSSIETVYRWVEQWATERSDVKVLVKGRPAADDPDPPETLKSAAFFRSVSSDEITIEEVLTFADVAVSGYSTALLDAAAAAVPAVSADPGGVLGALPLDVLAVAKPCVSYQEFAEAMNRAITDRHLVLGGIPTEVLPEFEQTYRTRVSSVLREHGLLDQPAVR